MKRASKRTIRLSAFTVVFLLIAGGAAEANGPPIHTDTAFVTGLHGAAFRTFTEVVDKSAPGRELRIIKIPLAVPFELIPNRFVVGGTIPFLDKEMEVTTPSGQTVMGDSGFGDLSLFAKYQVLQKDRPGGTTRLTLLGRVKMPTGEDDAKASDGTPLPRPLQLGTGAFDYSGGAVVTSLKQRWGLNADLLYTKKTSDEGFRFGDSLRYDVAFAYRTYPKVYETYPSPQLNLFLEFNGESQEKNEMGGFTISDSGGTTVFLSPGIQYMAGRTFLVESSIQVPVVENLNGNQLETDYTFLVGIRWLLF